MPSPPTGTVTFLFTDIEGSTQRWEKFPAAMAVAVEEHDTLLRNLITQHDGLVFKTIGDAFCAAFSSPKSGVAAALKAQREIASRDWGEVAPLRVRMALHTGTAQERDDDYFGPTVNRVARILGVGHGGQTLLSQSTRQLIEGSEPEGAELFDFGAHRLKDLAQPEQIFGLLVPDLEREFPPLKSLDRQVHNLPVHPTPLIGRDREVAEVLKLLREDSVRLVTLSGAGGTGKTRLSLQIAADLTDEFPDGVYFVSLAHARETEEVVTEIQQALKLRESGESSALDGLQAHLKERVCLLVLDNFEQVTATAHLLADLMAAAPRLKLLVTSQSILRLRGEREFPLPPLELPPKRLLPLNQMARVPAVELFVARAQAVRPEFELTSENVKAVAEICRRLDGLPLALELAAARSKLLTPQAMLGHLKNRLKLLTGGARDLPQRQRTLRDAIAWSHDLLDEEEKVLLRRVAVFQEGFNLEAALAVTELEGGAETDIFGGVEALADKSLLRQREENGEIRFSMLENIREFGLEQLAASGETTTIQSQHAAYFGQWMEALAREAESDPSLSMQACDAEQENLRAALEWRLNQAPSTAGSLAIALSVYWERQGRFRECRETISRCLSQAGEQMQPRDKAKLLGLGGWFFHLGGDNIQARQLTEKSLALWQELGAVSRQADALNDLALIAQAEGEIGTASDYLDKSLALVRRSDNRHSLAVRLTNFALLAIEQGEFEKAGAALTEANTLYEELGDTSGVAVCLCNLSELELRRGAPGIAKEFAARGLVLFRELQDQRGVALTLSNLAEAVLESGEGAEAIPYLEEAIPLAVVDMHWLLPIQLENLALAYRTFNKEHQASLALAGATVFRTRFAMPRDVEETQKWSAKELEESEKHVHFLSKMDDEAITVHIIENRNETE